MADTPQIDKETLDIFLVEARDTLTSWEQACLALDRSGTDMAAVDELFRVAHSLKGTARAVGLLPFGDFIHHVEDVINKVKRNELVAGPELISFLFACQDTLRTWIDGLASNDQFQPPLSHIETQIQDFLSGKMPAAVVPMATASEAVVVEQAPQPSPVKQAATSTPQPSKKSGEDSKASAADESVRLPIRKLDELIQLVGELSIQQAIVMHELNHGQMNSNESRKAVMLGYKIVKDLQHKALNLRMQTLQGLFQRLERTARDIARQQSKDIEVIVRGDDVELDKNVIEKVVDSMVHIVRNAVDHGIENAEGRAAAGKPTTAKIRFEAIQEADSVILEITDDGRGLDEEKILKKAIEKGLIDAKAQQDQSTVFSLIMIPGFSTADKITDVSGRGVGMDVVRKTVEDLNGRIEISSEKGKGSVFRVTLPTSVSILDALVVEINGHKYVAPIKALEEVVDSQRCAVETTGGKGKMISIRGQFIPLFSLPHTLKMMSSVDDKCSAALVVRSGQKQLALLVNQVVTQHQVVVRPLPEKYQNLNVFNGSTILSNGEPSFILDVAYISRKLVEETQKKEQVA
jgi:two-component system chemotaxis sensor kinase CheA